MAFEYLLLYNTPIPEREMWQIWREIFGEWLLVTEKSDSYKILAQRYFSP